MNDKKKKRREREGVKKKKGNVCLFTFAYFFVCLLFCLFFGRMLDQD